MTYQITITNTYKPEIYRNPYDISPTIHNTISENEYLSDAKTLDDGTIQIPLYKRSGYLVLPAQSIWTAETDDADEVAYYQNILFNNINTQIINNEGDDDMVAVHLHIPETGDWTVDKTPTELKAFLDTKPETVRIFVYDDNISKTYELSALRWFVYQETTFDVFGYTLDQTVQELDCTDFLLSGDLTTDTWNCSCSTNTYQAK